MEGGFLLSILNKGFVSSKTSFNFMLGSEKVGEKYWILHYPGFFALPIERIGFRPKGTHQDIFFVVLHIFTARNGKVMFLQVSVCPRGDVSQHAFGQRGVHPSMHWTERVSVTRRVCDQKGLTRGGGV